MKFIKQKVLAMKYHPDKNAGDKEAEKIFQQLQEAKEILCNPEKRLLYDKWKNSGLQVSYKNWIGMKEHVVSVRRLSIANYSRKMFFLFSNNPCTGQIQRPKIACCRTLMEQVIYKPKERIPR